MVNWFQLQQPSLLTLLIAALATVAALLRTERAAIRSPRSIRVLITAGCGAAALLAAITLQGMRTTLSQVLLLTIAAAAGVMLTIELYQRRPRGAAPESIAWAGLFRVAALLGLVTLVSRPIWTWVETEFERPLLVVVVDQSRSMSIVDAAGEGSRAARVAAAVQDAESALRRLENAFEVQVFGFGDEFAMRQDWDVSGDGATTALAAALREAAQQRSPRGDPPQRILLVSDGAENSADPQLVRQAAAELAAQGCGLIALGVGAAAEHAPGVVIDPLATPARVGSKDRLRVPVGARVTGCDGYVAGVELFWSGDAGVSKREARLSGSPARVRQEFETVPPGPGLRRLTARVTLPAERGGASVERSAVIDVRDEAIEVVVVDSQPRSEGAFLARTLRSDPRYHVTIETLNLDEQSPGQAIVWESFDAVVLGPGAARLSAPALAALRRAITERGVGLALLGGPEFFGDTRLPRGDLAALSPVDLGAAQPDEYSPKLSPTRIGAVHPVFAQPKEGSEPGWSELPPLGACARLGRPRPLAQVLAADEQDWPLIAVQEVGAGRTAALAFGNTWTWALYSEAGLALHRRFWRQTVEWLANRRPTPWVITDEATYALAAIQSGQTPIRVRAGLSGETPTGAAAPQKARLTLQRSGLAAAGARSASTAPASAARRLGPVEVNLRRSGDEWTAELPSGLAGAAAFEAAEYELVFTVEDWQRGGDAGPPRGPLTARTSFSITTIELELRPPTSNLALLRAAADATASNGGTYAGIDNLKGVLEKLLSTDPRRRVDRMREFDPLDRGAALIFAWVAGALAMEWIVRRSVGMR